MPSKISLYHFGSTVDLPQQHLLKAGHLNVLYENGHLRYIKLGGQEVLRMIYSAVRDTEWGTVHARIYNETITSEERSFEINYDVEYLEPPIHFVAHHQITGSENDTITFKVNGTAQTTFLRNRIGICVLHPIKECSGKAFTVKSSTQPNQGTNGEFPFQIGPGLLATAISEMTWEINGLVRAHLDFEGDLFEMEDQRNWTDHSYKTYCTPLAVAYPARLTPGDTVSQVVTLSLSGIVKPESHEAQENPLTFSINPRQTFSIPIMGLEKSPAMQGLNPLYARILSRIGFAYYRIDVLFEADWKSLLTQGMHEAEMLDSIPEIALFYNSESHRRYTAELIDFLQEQAIKYFDKPYPLNILLLDSKASTTSQAVIDHAVPLLKAAFPMIRVGAGTNQNFTDLNRNPLKANLLDFICYSFNPQVHATDNRSLIENLEGQGSTIHSASQLYPGKPVHISTVTLKPRPSYPEQQREENTMDPRQMSLFGAAWCLGSIKNLTQAGAACITYFEATGPRGFINTGTTRPWSALQVYPAAAVFYEVIKHGHEAKVFESTSSDPLRFDTLVLAKGETLYVILSNYTPDTITVELPLIKGKRKSKFLNSGVLKDPDWFTPFSRTERSSQSSDGTGLQLEPFELAFLEFSPYGFGF